MFSEDWSIFFAPGQPGVEPVTLAGGPPLHAMVDRGTQLVQGVVLEDEVSIVLPAAWAASAAEGQSVALADGPHLIRRVLEEPPDGALKRLILVKV